MLTEVLVRAGYQLLFASAEVNNLNIIITEDMHVSEKVVFDDFLRKDHFFVVYQLRWLVQFQCSFPKWLLKL